MLKQCSIYLLEHGTEPTYSRIYHEGKEAMKKLEGRLVTALVVQDRGFDPPMATFSLSWGEANRRHFACLASGCTGRHAIHNASSTSIVNRQPKCAVSASNPSNSSSDDRTQVLICCSYSDSIRFYLLIVLLVGSVKHSFPWVVFAGTCHWLLHYCFSGSPSISHCRSSTRPSFDVSRGR